MTSRWMQNTRRGWDLDKKILGKFLAGRLREHLLVISDVLWHD